MFTAILQAVAIFNQQGIILSIWEDLPLITAFLVSSLTCLVVYFLLVLAWWLVNGMTNQNSPTTSTHQLAPNLRSACAEHPNHGPPFVTWTRLLKTRYK